MPESERVQTLTELQQTKLETNKQLEKLPIQVKSIKVAQLKKQLEDKLDRLEKAIATFSK
jgi:hypothetical protein